MEKRLKKLEKKFHHQYVSQESFCEFEKYCVAIAENLEYKLWQEHDLNNKLIYQLLLAQRKQATNFRPLVSIVIPAYNANEYLSCAISSALSQTYDNIEIIVINDGSNDGGKTADVAKKFGKKIRYYEKENGGVSSALNFGISKMHGEYFTWLSHDDLMDEDHIANLVDCLSFFPDEKVIPFSGFKFIDKDGNIKFNETVSLQLSCYDFRRSYIKNELSLLQGEINGGSVIIPKNAFKECGLFDEKLRITQERDMWARLMKKYHFINVPFDTASIRQHDKQVSSDTERVAAESNAKNLDIITSLSDDTIKNLFGTKVALYENLRRFYSSNGNSVISNELTNMIEANKKHDKK